MTSGSIAMHLRHLLLTALAYWGTGQLALHLAVPPGFASPVFPPAGIALAATLAWGPAGLLGAGLGSMWLNIGSQGLAQPAGFIMVALGAMLQAGLGAAVMHRVLQWPAPLDSASRIAGFVALATAGCLISPTVGVGALTWLERIPAEQAVFSWWNWWLGDALGVLLAFPLLQLSGSAWRAYRWQVGPPLCAGALVLGVVFLQYSRWDEERLRTQFQAEVAGHADTVRQRVRGAMEAGVATELFLRYSDQVTDEEFSGFAPPWFGVSPAVHALGVVTPHGAVGAQGRGSDAVVLWAAADSASPWRLAGRTLDQLPDIAALVARVRASGALAIGQHVGGGNGLSYVALARPVRARGTQTASDAVVLVLVPRERLLPDGHRLHLCLIDRTARPPVVLAGAGRCALAPGFWLHQTVSWQTADGAWTLLAEADQDYVTAFRGKIAWMMPVLAWAAGVILAAFVLGISVRTRRIEALVARRTEELRQSEQRLGEMLENIHLLAVQLDCAGHIVFCNAFLGSLLGLRPRALCGRDWFSAAVPPERAGPERAAFVRLVNGEDPPGRSEGELLLHSGERRVVGWSWTVIRDGGGRVVGIAGIGEDITARRQIEAEREKAWALLSAAIAQSPAGILVADAPSMKLRMVNPAAIRFRHPEAADVPATPEALERFAEGWRVMRPDGSPCPEASLPLVRAIRNRESVAGEELILCSDDGCEHWVSVNAAPVLGPEGEVLAGIVVFNDISQLKDQQLRLERLAHFDALTRLPNRVLLADRLGRELERARRLGTSFAVGYLDLDGFKAVNDRFGHDAGDALLVEIASRLRGVLRAEDSVARLGGDEFVLLLVALEAEGGWRPAVQRVLAEVARPLDVLGHTVRVSGSVGVTVFPDDDAEPELLLRHADQAMYQAKQSGGAGVHLFDPEQDRRVRSRQVVVARLEQALAGDEIVLHYQPRVNLRSGRVEGVEALVRWQHPEEGLLAPAAFLPAVENSPLMLALGDRILRLALAQAAAWHDAGMALEVSINLAAVQLQDAGFVAGLRSALAMHPRLSPHWIEFEILETAALEDVAQVGRVIDECAGLGVRFALDDFGTGYSSLSYFRRLPAQVLKIDQSFIRDMLHDPEDLAIVQGVIGLADVFRRTVVAEGVETALHGAMLLWLGCERAQGYGIAKPMPAGLVARWVEAWRPDPVWRRRLDRLSQADVGLLAAEVEHASWIDAVVAAVRSGDPSRSVPRIDRRSCRLGVWLAAAAYPAHAGLAGLGGLRTAHDALHDLAEQIGLGHGAGRDMSDRLPALLAARDHLFGLMRAVWLGD